jgi:hypothetical protein
VDDIFGDDGLGTYGTDWVIFSYDTANNKYVKPTLSDTLSQGVGIGLFRLLGKIKLWIWLKKPLPPQHVQVEIALRFL